MDDGEILLRLREYRRGLEKGGLVNAQEVLSNSLRLYEDIVDKRGMSDEMVRRTRCYFLDSKMILEKRGIEVGEEIRRYNEVTNRGREKESEGKYKEGIKERLMEDENPDEGAVRLFENRKRNIKKKKRDGSVRNVYQLSRIKGLFELLKERYFSYGEDSNAYREVLESFEAEKVKLVGEGVDVSKYDTGSFPEYFDRRKIELCFLGGEIEDV